jgi:hypothetical protein
VGPVVCLGQHDSDCGCPGLQEGPSALTSSWASNGGAGVRASRERQPTDCRGAAARRAQRAVTLALPLGGPAPSGRRRL